MDRTDTTATASQESQRRAAFSRLILRHEGKLTRAARHLCRGDEDRAQDLVQDTLVRAYQACLSGRFREDGNTDAWLRRIATNLYINDYRRRRRWEADGGLSSRAACRKMAEASQEAASGRSPAALLLSVTLDEAVEQALDSLPEAMRRCLLLVDLEGQDYAQAARSLGIPIGTVRSRLSRSRRLLRPLLRSYAEERTGFLAQKPRGECDRNVTSA